MATQNTVWILISCDGVTNRIRNLLDRGFFAEADHISTALKSFVAKVSKEAEAKGGHVFVALLERVVMEIPLTFAEELPNIIEGFKEVVNDEVAAGLGMTFEEAAIAASKSVVTGEIELYNPDNSDGSPDYFKSTAEETDTTFELPANVFDTTKPPSPEPEPKRPNRREPPAAQRPEISQEIQLETQYVQAVAQTMGAPSPEEMQQQIAAAKQAQGQVDGLPPELQAALQGQSEESEEGGDKSSKKDSKGKKSGDKSPKKDSKDEDQDDDDDDGDEEANSKLGQLLLTAKKHLPDIMELKDKDPKAFEQAIKLVQKLADLTRTRKKVEKSEHQSDIQQLNEDFAKAVGHKWPVGTRKGRKQKVMINGKAAWRSMASGRVQDAKGQPISVKSHNAAAEAGKQTEQ